MFGTLSDAAPGCWSRPSLARAARTTLFGKTQDPTYFIETSWCSESPL